MRYDVHNVGCSTEAANTSWNALHPSGAGPSFVVEAPIQMIRAPAQLVSRRSMLPTGNLATTCWSTARFVAAT